MARSKQAQVAKQYANPDGGPSVEAQQADGQVSMFGADEDFHVYWREWQGMPEFVQGDLEPDSSLIVNFASPDDRKAFAELVGQNITPFTRSIWHPKAEVGRFSDKRWLSRSHRQPSAPLYIVSKGRWDIKPRMTHSVLHKMGVKHRMVVERSELDRYQATVGDTAELVVLDPQYQRDYDCFDDLGLSKSPGPGPARNFAWDHAISEGATWHWVMDDNIMGFHRFDRNIQIPMADGTGFRVMEDFVARYSNVLMAGPQYFMFIARKTRLPPFVPNTRIYSCNLIRNDAPYRWRGRYNEDTDLSLRMLKDGWATIQFNAFTQDKLQTQRMAGGNTEAFYGAEGTRPKSEMLKQMHPDVTEVVWKFGRWHHQVDYSPWKLKNRLVRKPIDPWPSGTDEYGMVLERLDAYGNWVPELSRRWDAEMPLGDLQVGMGM